MTKDCMLTTKDAIENRRSIRKFKPDPISPEILKELIEEARLAPSNGNAQPWRFKIVTDQATKIKLATASFNQKFIAEAPVVLVCCASLNDYVDSIAKGAKELGAIHAVEKDIVNTVLSWTDYLRSLPLEQLAVKAGFHVGIAIEHIILRALDYDLGTCWITPNSAKVNEIFGWDKNIFVVALIPIGYPAENPKPRRRKLLTEIIMWY